VRFGLHTERLTCQSQGVYFGLQHSERCHHHSDRESYSDETQEPVARSAHAQTHTLPAGVVGVRKLGQLLEQGDKNEQQKPPADTRYARGQEAVRGVISEYGINKEAAEAEHHQPRNDA